MKARWFGGGVCLKLGGAVLAVLPVAAFAQPPVVPTESAVLVDALVRDKKGKPVSDLRAQDFHLWEDGKEQPIASLAQERVGPARQPEAGVYRFPFRSGGIRHHGAGGGGKIRASGRRQLRRG